MAVMFFICALFWSFAFVLFYCEFGERVSNAFEDIHDTIGQFEWYVFPIKTQKLLPTLLTVAKQQVSIEAFGNFACEREIFKRVSVKGQSQIYTNTHTSERNL